MHRPLCGAAISRLHACEPPRECEEKIGLVPGRAGGDPFKMGHNPPIAQSCGPVPEKCMRLSLRMIIHASAAAAVAPALARLNLPIAAPAHAQTADWLHG